MISSGTLSVWTLPARVLGLVLTVCVSFLLVVRLPPASVVSAFSSSSSSALSESSAAIGVLDQLAGSEGLGFVGDLVQL